MRACAVAAVIFGLLALAFGGSVDRVDESFALLRSADSSVNEDAHLNMVQLATKYGYPIEKHTVQTEDGYLLTLYRIPYGRHCGPRDQPKPPVLVQHGLLESSVDFIILGPKTSLGYFLADNCYDVWLGNNRGNGESRKHVFLKPSEKEFWSFSWHEMGIYDLPALIDYVLASTNQSSLHYIGHSQGTTQFFVMGSLRPQYHKKIRSMHCLSPVAFMKNLASPIVRLLTKFSDTIQAIAERLGIYEIFPSQTLLNVLGTGACKDQYPEFQEICCNVMFLLCGFDKPQMNKTMLPAILGHTPAGAGVGSLIHYAQGVRSGQFKQYDYGEKKNMKIYNSKTPPDYPVHRINVPMALYYGQNDFLAAVKDVNKIASMLPNVIEKYLVPFSTFNHLDFVFACELRQLLHEKLLQVLSKY